MLQDSLRNIFAIPDLRKRVLFTFGLLAVYRVGGHIRPRHQPRGAEGAGRAGGELVVRRLRHVLRQNLSQMTVFALGVMPYISASIILQLLTVVWPYLERLSKEGRARAAEDHAVRATARSC